MELRITTILLVVLTASGCTIQFLLADTTSDQITEYRNDYYVAYSPDSILEFHYDLWSENAVTWLSVLNRSDRVIILQPDSCFVRFEGVRHVFDQSVDWTTYVQPFLQDTLIILIDVDHSLPLLPGQWKGMLGPELNIKIQDWQAKTGGISYTRESTPIRFYAKVCYREILTPGDFRCVEHEIWIEKLDYMNGRDFRALEKQTDFEKSDKFYLFHIPGDGLASFLMYDEIP